MNRFNPRPREGATTKKPNQRRLSRVSIHAPVKGRPICPVFSMARDGFNPRPREGATGTGVDLILSHMFQSTPP